MDIIIVMSTYNGARYIAAQLDSILNQKMPCHKIIIRDDGSLDDTLDILFNYSQKYSQIIILLDTVGSIGIEKSYQLLLNYALTLRPDYVMFSDQDDIWLDDKISLLMQKKEVLKSCDTPLLIFTDAVVVDSYLNVIAPSFIGLQKFTNLNKLSLKSVLLYCPALGCTMMFNRKLLELIVKNPVQNMNPDQWALVHAALYGQIIYVPEITVYYRQHLYNLAGALKGVKRNLFDRQNIRFIKERYQLALDQARNIRNSNLKLGDKNSVIIEQFIRLFTGGPVVRFIHWQLYFTSVPHWKRKLGLFLSLFFKYE